AFWRLGQASAARRLSAAALGRGQLLVKGGRRLPSGEFVPGRAQLTYNPQAYAWESLREPVRAQSFAEVAARLAALPPPALRPRRVAEDLCVLPVARVEDAAFAPAEQAVRAALWDLEAGTAALVLPYLTRAAEGAEAALALLRRRPESVRFAAGRVRLGAGGLVVEPVGLVYDD